MSMCLQSCAITAMVTYKSVGRIWMVIRNVILVPSLLQKRLKLMAVMRYGNTVRNKAAAACDRNTRKIKLDKSNRTVSIRERLNKEQCSCECRYSIHLIFLLLEL